ncbi:hypothetical protein [Burkholderia gladioli]|uniref:hypothetical protein n=1 Tax=Burkholderia gladioli TaxID=28095 RepID=UPI00163E8495|nr:hypothetical protein [Burkholderia gladioli]
MSLYRRFYRQKNTPFAGGGLRGIDSSSISFDHTGLATALQLPKSRHSDMLHDGQPHGLFGRIAIFTAQRIMAVAVIGLPQGAFDFELFLQS